MDDQILNQLSKDIVDAVIPAVQEDLAKMERNKINNSLMSSPLANTPEKLPTPPPSPAELVAEDELVEVKLTPATTEASWSEEKLDNDESKNVEEQNNNEKVENDETINEEKVSDRPSVDEQSAADRSGADQSEDKKTTSEEPVAEEVAEEKVEEREKPSENEEIKVDQIDDPALPVQLYIPAASDHMSGRAA
ncbi:hypothetical protein Q1695_004566 [Nippostrongylus brasiliensis]|nr:hypothetical protein Q1695_004566 [Nippostrongylus brasiliensis]